MLQTTLIGHLGSDAEFKSVNGKEFTAFRVANSERWTDDNGTVHDETQWVDCIINGKPGVLPYLKKGQQVCVIGSSRTRVYSSKKDRCMKAGLTINARTIELLGGKSDEIPSQLFDANSGASVDIKKWYNAPSLVRDENQPEWIPLLSRSQEQFIADRNGWIQKYEGDQQ